MALTSGPNLGLLIDGSQGEGHYTELLRFFRGVDGLVMLSVKEIGVTAPPATPANGDRYIVGANGTGDFAYKQNQVARYNGSGWDFYAPRNGWLTHSAADDAFYIYRNGAWVKHLGAASAGWAPATGTATRTAFDTATVTLPELAEHVKALIDDLVAQGRLTP